MDLQLWLARNGVKKGVRNRDAAFCGKPWKCWGSNPPGRTRPLRIPPPSTRL